MQGRYAQTYFNKKNQDGGGWGGVVEFFETLNR